MYCYICIAYVYIVYVDVLYMMYCCIVLLYIVCIIYVYMLYYIWSLDEYAKGGNGGRLGALHFWLTVFVFLVNVFFYWNV